MSAAAERRTLTAYTLYEGLMRAVSAGDPNEAMDIEGSEALTPQLLLGGQEPSPEEEDLWFRQRSRWGTRQLAVHTRHCIVLHHGQAASGGGCCLALPARTLGYQACVAVHIQGWMTARTHTGAQTPFALRAPVMHGLLWSTSCSASCSAQVHGGDGRLGQGAGGH